jgi:hypothetical protein
MRATGIRRGLGYPEPRRSGDALLGLAAIREVSSFKNFDTHLIPNLQPRSVGGGAGDAPLMHGRPWKAA